MHEAQMERFSNDCRKTNTRVMTQEKIPSFSLALTNHNRTCIHVTIKNYTRLYLTIKSGLH